MFRQGNVSKQFFLRLGRPAYTLKFCHRLGNRKKRQPIKGEWLRKSIPKLPEQSNATFDSQLVHQRRVIRGSVQLCVANDVVTKIAARKARV